MKQLKNEKGFTIIELVVVLAILSVGVIAIGTSIYGLYLAFSASIILGIIALVIEPSPFVFGVCMIFGKNVPEAIQNWANFPI